MNSLPVFIEEGKKKTFAGALGWPGWCRSGKDQESALQALINYAPRYRQVLKFAPRQVDLPEDLGDIEIKEKVEGNATTSFGAPAVILQSDLVPAEEIDYQFWKNILAACWKSFDNSYQNARGKDLLKGPRGGGRDSEGILNHIMEGDLAYLRRVARNYRRHQDLEIKVEIENIRQEIITVLDIAENQGLPEQGPRGGVIWPVRFFIRRLVWHTLDHQWEIEDRLIVP